MPTPIKTALLALQTAISAAFPVSNPASPSTTLNYFSANSSGPTMVSVTVTMQDGTVQSASYPIA